MSELLKLPEVAERLGVSDKTVRRYVKAGVLPSVFIGNSYRITEGDIEEFLRISRVGPGGKRPKVKRRSSDLELPFDDVLEEGRRGPTLEQVEAEFRPLREALDSYTSRWEKRLGKGNLGREAVQLFLEDVRDIHEFFLFAVGSELHALAGAMDLVGDHPYHQLPEDAATSFTRAELLEKSLIHPALRSFYALGRALAQEVGDEMAADQLRRWRDALPAAA